VAAETEHAEVGVTFWGDFLHCRLIYLYAQLLAKALRDLEYKENELIRLRGEYNQEKSSGVELRTVRLQHTFSIISMYLLYLYLHSPRC
jgi:hypothetical protein